MERARCLRSGLTMILVVENNAEMRETLVDMILDLGHPVRQAGNGYEAFTEIKDQRPTLVITELEMPGGRLSYISLLRAQMPRVPILVLTTFGGSIPRTEVLNAGATAYLTKPVRASELRNQARALLKAQHRPRLNGACISHGRA